MEPAQYDAIASAYDGIEMVAGQQIVIAAMSPHADMVNGKTVVDLACGSGFWTRWAMVKGATSVIGIDISPEMISAGRRAETFGGKIQYHVKDCSEPLVSDDGLPILPEPVDVVIAAWLLNYAADEVTQLKMWQNISKCLKPGGQFLALIPDLEADLTDAPYDPKYGVDAVKLEDVNVGRPDHGAKLRRNVLVQPPIHFDMYQLNRGVYKRCADGAGMTDVRFERNFALPTEGKPEGFWDVYKDRPQVELLTAVRA